MFFCLFQIFGKFYRNIEKLKYRKKIITDVMHYISDTEFQSFISFYQDIPYKAVLIIKDKFLGKKIIVPKKTPNF